MIASWQSFGYPRGMSDRTLADLLERIVLAGVAITTRALSEASPGFDLTFPQWRALLVVGERQGEQP